ncbi:MAG: oxidoreductase [Bacteroidetes bacterium]|nr:MAG: oxidoreductase [Bacteroidota bacterium]REK07235.1 MAG: oxidoreductase [Bacteroidota bacterium]REK31778.1 MAG: oxidoreductase [Bacteroidota bacterium]REK48042.1 MAG: oxidoreductase [Bacteroidota bacterium]
MEQLTQNLKDGRMELLEVPFPVLQSGSVLVRNHYSLISAGTEGKTVKDARAGLIAKARSRKEEVKKVIEAAKTFGWKETYRMVMNKLDAPSALGYSCAGEIIAVADDVKDFSVGDLVACGGSGANHAEVVCVPVNLCVKVPKNVSLDHASFTTLGAIALQGIRQADLRLGENCAVIGLGLIGQLTVQMLKASGVKVACIDISDEMVRLSKESGGDLCLNRNREDAEQQLIHFSEGHGCDSVIITAGTNSTDPVDFAGAICRKKGKVIIVGAVPTGFKRSNFYRKELDLRMSSSYGPGRYDPEYEEKGIDYPYAYVRWTENRNMSAFVNMLSEGKVHLNHLLTHQFDFNAAPKAYNMILERTESFGGIVLKYDLASELKSVVELRKKSIKAGEPVLGVIGAGSFGQNILLPAVKGKATLLNVVTARPNHARDIADKFGFTSCSGNPEDIFSNPDINTVMIATRHNTHADFVLKAIDSGKHVFVEKPLCVTRDEFEEIKHRYTSGKSILMVGFNRRFSFLTRKLKSSLIQGAPVSMIYRINAGYIPTDHWVHDPQAGGGRIIGEVCHFIDLCMYLSGSEIISVAAQKMYASKDMSDTVGITLTLQNGSIAQIAYYANGNKSLAKEYIELHTAGLSAVMEDFRSLKLHGKSVTELKIQQDKGHKAELDLFLESVRQGKESPIPFNEICMTTAATFAVIESIALKGQPVYL